jgi:hypothetical protein
MPLRMRDASSGREQKQIIANEIRVPFGIARLPRESRVTMPDREGKIWVRWSNAIREAGFQPNKFWAVWDEATLIEEFIEASGDQELVHPTTQTMYSASNRVGDGALR